jgi:Ran GTPase-activating protein (RanGAP) involved in mRNA processing and transport
VNLDDITSNEDNAEILEKLRDDDATLKWITFISDRGGDFDFVIREGDDLGWLGYFLGKSKQLKEICISDLPEKREQIDELIDGLTRNQSIEKLQFWCHKPLKELGPSAAFRNKPKLHEFELQIKDIFGSEDARILSSMLSFMSLTSFRVEGQEEDLMDVDAEIISALSEHSQLKGLSLDNVNVGRTSCQALGTMLKSGASNLERLDLKYCNINDEGLKLIAAGIDSSSFLRRLFLMGNEISDAGMRSLSTALESTNCIDYLDLSCNSISDKGVQALATSLANSNLSKLSLSGIEGSITSLGLRSFRCLLRSECCLLKTLELGDIRINDEVAIALADGLVGNHSLKKLSISLKSITRVGRSAFARLLCDTSSINKTYLSNHTLEHIGSICIGFNKFYHQKDSAKCKILKFHKLEAKVPSFDDQLV